MFHEVDFLIAFGVPQVDGEDIEGCVDLAGGKDLALDVVLSSAHEVIRLLDIDLVVGMTCIVHQQSNAWRRCNRSSVLDIVQFEHNMNAVKGPDLIAEPTHSRSDWLLNDLETSWYGQLVRLHGQSEIRSAPVLPPTHYTTGWPWFLRGCL